MKTISIEVKGPFIDGFVYRTQLYAITYSGELRRYQIGHIEQSLVESFGEAARAATYLLFHTKGKGSSSAQRQAYFNREWSGRLVVEAENIPFESFDIGIEGSRVLDLRLYRDTVFMSSDAGLWSGDVTAEMRSFKIRKPLRSACYSIAVRWDAVAASRGPKGLTLLFDYFSDDSGRGEYQRTEQISQPSLRSSYAGYALVNYSSRSRFSVLEADVEVDSDSGEGQRSRMVSVRKPEAGAERLASASDLGGPDDFEFAFNFGSTFVTVADGVVYSAQTRRHSAVHRSFGSLEPIGEVRGRVIGGSWLDGYPILETKFGVVCIDHKRNESLVIFDRPPVSVRSFPGSIRYKRLTLIAGDEGISLVGLAE